MHEHDKPTDPEAPHDAPAAAQWMKQQAAAHEDKGEDTPRALSPGDSSAPALLPAPGAPSGAGPQPKSLAERERRVVSGLVGNRQVTEGLEESAARELLAWGVDVVRAIVGDTAGLDDAAAEDVLQPRVRATRRLMMSVGKALNEPDAADEHLEAATQQAAVALGERFAPPPQAELLAFRRRWRAQQDRPTEQIAGLRRLVDSSTRPAL